MKKDPTRNAARRRGKERRLGHDASCAFCGVNDLAKLTTIDRSSVEEHHVVGRQLDDALVITVCLNCHRGLTEGLKDAGLEGWTPETLLHRIAGIFEGLIQFLVGLVRALRCWKDALLELIKQLDEHYPEWRKLGTAA